jgi:hypothetical protein
VNVGVTPSPRVTTPIVAPDFRYLKPAAEVWPQAIRTLPTTLPDGRPYQVAAALGGDRYVLRSGIPYQGGELFLYDLRNRSTTRLGSPMPAGWGTKHIVTVNDGVVAWVRNNGDQYEIWTWLTSGGTPTLAASVTTAANTKPSWATATGGRVYWQDGGELRSTPIDGGKIAIIRDVVGPDSKYPNLTVAGTGLARPMPGPWLHLRANEFYNLTTGKRLKLEFGDAWWCSLDWCADGPRGTRTIRAQRADGTGSVDSGITGSVVVGGLGGRIAFGMVWPPVANNVPYVWDLQTGLAGVIDASDPPKDFYLTMVQLGRVDLGEHRILDFTAL